MKIQCSIVRFNMFGFVQLLALPGKFKFFFVMNGTETPVGFVCVYVCVSVNLCLMRYSVAAAVVSAVASHIQVENKFTVGKSANIHTYALSHVNTHTQSDVPERFSFSIPNFHTDFRFHWDSR